MKRLIIFLALLVLASAMVMAQGPQGSDDAPGADMEKPEPVLYQTTDQEMIQARNASGNGTGPVMMQNGTMLHIGLTNALEHVTNEKARAALERNMARFIERYQARMGTLDDVTLDSVDEETGAVELKAKQEVKYLGFIKGKATKRFEVAEGKISEKAPWYSFFYSSAVEDVDEVTEE